MKSYNTQALRGEKIDDTEFQQEMREIGINIPDALLYTPALNGFMLNAIHQQNVNSMSSEINPKTNRTYTPDEAHREANGLRDAASKNISDLMS